MKMGRCLGKVIRCHIDIFHNGKEPVRKVGCLIHRGRQIIADVAGMVFDSQILQSIIPVQIIRKGSRGDNDLSGSSFCLCFIQKGYSDLVRLPGIQSENRYNMDGGFFCQSTGKRVFLLMAVNRKRYMAGCFTVKYDQRKQRSSSKRIQENFRIIQCQGKIRQIGTQIHISFSCLFCIRNVCFKNTLYRLVQSKAV